MLDRVGADGLAVHLNPVQELVQPEGDTDWRDVLPSLEHLCRELDFPVIVKEVGCCISPDVAVTLESAGVACIDVAGAGGTCFAKVEQHRGPDIAGTFSEWGIPTSESVLMVKEAAPDIPIIASGGIRTGIDIAKAIALGASGVGIALPLLSPALESPSSVEEALKSMTEVLRIVMFCIGAASLAELGQTKHLVKRE